MVYIVTKTYDGHEEIVGVFTSVARLRSELAMQGFNFDDFKSNVMGEYGNGSLTIRAYVADVLDDITSM